jgi:hypothetical protein
MTIRTTLSAAIMALTLATATFAADLTPAEQSGLQTRIDNFERAFQSGDMVGVIGVIPPRIVAEMSGDFGMTPDALRSAMVTATEQAMASVTIVSYAMDLPGADIGKTGSGRTYALIPTRTVMQASGQKMQSDTRTLGFADEDGWHLVRIDDANQVQMLIRAYPDFKGVSFPSGTMKVIE